MVGAGSTPSATASSTAARSSGTQPAPPLGMEVDVREEPVELPHFLPEPATAGEAVVGYVGITKGKERRVVAGEVLGANGALTHPDISRLPPDEDVPRPAVIVSEQLNEAGVAHVVGVDPAAPAGGECGGSLR